MSLRAAARFRPRLMIVALAVLAGAAFVGFGHQGGGGRRPLIGAGLVSATNFGLTGTVGNLTPGLAATLNLSVTNPYTVPIDLTSVTVTVSPTPTITSVPANCSGTLLSLNSVPFTGATPSATYTYPTWSEPVIPASSSTPVPLTLLLDRNAGNSCQNVTFPFNYAATATYGLSGPCINNTTNGGYAVQKGQAICITGRVNGGVTVNSGGALYLNGATINGGVTSSGAVAVQICGSTVSGSASVSGTTGVLMIGDNGDDQAEGTACTTNTLKGGVTLTGNQAGFELGGNTISGTVSITNNSGNGPTTEDNLPEVEGNSIKGSLACSGNSSAPAYGNAMNTATGPKTGQCLGL